MSDLAAFLAARLDEDEAQTYAAEDLWLITDVQAREVQKRMLRDVEARRKILAECQRRIGDGINFTLSEQNFAEDVVRALAAVYSDHPDYRQEWA